MQLTAEQFEQIADLLPRQRGNVSMDNLLLINAILHVATSGCNWRALPRHYGNWHTIYTRMMRWSRSGVLDRIFERLQRRQLMRVRIEAISPPPAVAKGYPDGGAGAPLEPLSAAEAAGAPKCIWLPRMRPLASPGA
jgi:transposase